jgi:hypothetical protein
MHIELEKALVKRDLLKEAENRGLIPKKIKMTTKSGKVVETTRMVKPPRPIGGHSQTGMSGKPPLMAKDPLGLHREDKPKVAPGYEETDKYYERRTRGFRPAKTNEGRVKEAGEEMRRVVAPLVEGWQQGSSFGPTRATGSTRKTSYFEFHKPVKGGYVTITVHHGEGIEDGTVATRFTSRQEGRADSSSSKDWKNFDFKGIGGLFDAVKKAKKHLESFYQEG